MSNAWKIVDVIQWVTSFFNEHNIQNARLDADIIISNVLDLKRLELYLHFDQIVSTSEKEIIRSYIVRRANHEPLQQILGFTSFYGYDIKVTQDVLIPRPETELLVEELLLPIYQFDSVLDIGTGSGAIAIALKLEKNNLTIDAVDISEKALEIAKENAKNNNGEIAFFASDLFSNVQKKYDLIVSNPPYISEHDYKLLDVGILKYEPRLALVADENGVKIYRQIIEEAANYLHNNGLLAFEIGYNQAEEICRIAKKNQFMLIKQKKDLNDFDRILIFQKIN